MTPQYPSDVPMSHGFSRFGPPSARERFHAQTRRGGSLTMFLPTILATLFLFTAVIALNKVSSLSMKDAHRLIPVDQIFPTQADVERNRQKEFWETPPPPSPEEVMAAQKAPPPAFLEMPVRPSRPEVEVSTPLKIELPERLIPPLNTEIRMPEVKPDTTLPETVRP